MTDQIYPKKDRVPLSSILKIPGTYIWAGGMILLGLSQSGVFPPGSPTMAIIGAILSAMGFGQAGAWHPPRRPWSDDERQLKLSNGQENGKCEKK